MEGNEEEEGTQEHVQGGAKRRKVVTPGGRVPGVVAE